ncbi:DUF6132 family protein [soil metagenome]
MKNWFSQNLIYLAGAVIGAVAGYMYWKMVGCSSGTCLITSKPINSTIYGALMGSLLFGIFKKDNKKNVLKDNQHIDNDAI